MRRSHPSTCFLSLQLTSLGNPPVKALSVCQFEPELRPDRAPPSNGSILTLVMFSLLCRFSNSHSFSPILRFLYSPYRCAASQFSNFASPRAVRACWHRNPVVQAALMLSWLFSHHLLTGVYFDGHSALLISISISCFRCFAKLIRVRPPKNQTFRHFLLPA